MSESLHLDRDPLIDVGGALRSLRLGGSDPTTKLTSNDFWRATYTPDGPGTVRIRWTASAVTAQAWGDGAAWLSARVPAMAGLVDPGYHFGPESHPKILHAQRDEPGLRFAASGTLNHELVPAILGQRVTVGEAQRQWMMLCRELGDPAPGPNPALRLPPLAQRLADKPAWWYHPYGIEAKRAEAIRTVSRHDERIRQWSTTDAPTATEKLLLLRGVGLWTAAVAVAAAFGDPDAVAVGDFHIKNTVAWALSGQPRGTDEQMLELLAPYAGQRNRVIRLLQRGGHGAPKFGPRQRIQPMHRY